MKIKTLLIPTLVLFLLSVSSVSVFAQENNFDFSPAARDANLGFFGKLQIQPFTVAGQERDCSSDPIGDRGVVLERGFCGGNIGTFPNLINVYRIPPEGGKWIYLGEKEAPAEICYTDTYYQYAYEEYSCTLLVDQCSGTERRCVTETKYEYCVNAKWSSGYCSSGQTCTQGNCVSASTNVCREPTGSCWSEKQGHYCSGGNWVDVNCGSGQKCDPSTGKCSASSTTPLPEGWVCLDAWNKAYQYPSGGVSQKAFCEYGCKNGACESGAGGGGGIISYKLSIEQLNVPRAIKPGQLAEIDVLVKNPSSSEKTFNIEAGIYRSDYVKDPNVFGLYSVFQETIRQCGGVILGEQFVDAQKVTISANSQEWIHFTPEAPSSTSKFGSNAGNWSNQPNWEGEGTNYEVIVGIYDECAKGYTDDWESAHLTVTNEDIDTCGFWYKKSGSPGFSISLLGAISKTQYKLMNGQYCSISWGKIGLAIFGVFILIFVVYSYAMIQRGKGAFKIITKGLRKKKR